MIDFLMIAGGLILLFLGGEGLLRGSVAISRNLGLSKLLVSAVVIGFGTSMPELTVSVGAAIQGAPEIVLGNVVGSNTANILLILGVAALICPISFKDIQIKRDTVMVLACTLGLCYLASINSFNLLSGLIMFSVLVGYLVWSYRQDRAQQSAIAEHIVEDVEGETRLSIPRASVYTIVGLALLVGGAMLLIEGATSLARHFGISEAVIGLTIVAVGTSLPELATAVVSSLRRHSDVLIGNVLGSNIFNIMAILAITSMILPIPASGQIVSFDMWVMLGVTLILAPFLWFKLGIGRIAGGVMVASYVCYTLYLYMGTGS
jgi:cation:H+ antiporter